LIGERDFASARFNAVSCIMELLREKDMGDVKVIVGGIVPDEDAVELKRQGVAAVFQPGGSRWKRL
jgi:methylmalonyl-CoA mutase, C-terminal domain